MPVIRMKQTAKSVRVIIITEDSIERHTLTHISDHKYANRRVVQIRTNGKTKTKITYTSKRLGDFALLWDRYIYTARLLNWIVR